MKHIFVVFHPTREEDCMTHPGHSKCDACHVLYHTVLLCTTVNSIYNALLHEKVQSVHIRDQRTAGIFL